MGEKIVLVGSDDNVKTTLVGLIAKSEENARKVLKPCVVEEIDKPAFDELVKEITDKGPVVLEMVPNEPEDRVIVASEEKSYLFCHKDDRNQRISIELCLRGHEIENEKMSGMEGQACCRYYSRKDGEPDCTCPVSLNYLAANKHTTKEELKQARREQVANEKNEKKARAARKIIEREEQE